MRIIHFLISISLFLGCVTVLQAQTLPDSLEIKLVTVDPGDELTTWWGHTGLIVEDLATGHSLFYNYGLFSFEQDNFISNFARGRLIFWVGAWRTELALRFYKSQNRTIRIQTLNLPTDRKLEIAIFLANNVLPENREYLYDHYYDNCATRIRDIFNRVTNGEFETFTADPSRFTLREQTRRFTHRSFFMDWLLMFLMNDTIDQPVRQWDDMFLPTELEKYAGEFSYSDEQGVKHNFVRETNVFYSAENTYDVPEEPPVHWPAGLLFGIIAGIAGIGIARRKKSTWRLYGVYYLLLGVWFGIPGTILFLMALFTDHIVTYYNENLFLANPITFLLIPLGIGMIFNCQWALRFTPNVIYLLTGIALVLLPLKLLPVFDQANILSIMLILPVLLLNTLAWWRLGKHSASV